MEIVLKNVSYRYKNKRLLDRINLKIESKKITGITGDNKTILTELIDTIRFPSSGHITLDSEPVNKENIKRIRKDICLIFKKRYLSNQTKLVLSIYDR